jgi:hypothetical protein
LLDKWLATLVELERNCISPFIILTFCSSEFVEFLIGYLPPFSHIRTFHHSPRDREGKGGGEVTDGNGGNGVATLVPPTSERKRTRGTVAGRCPSTAARAGEAATGSPGMASPVV